jgi:hypothetical protein
MECKCRWACAAYTLKNVGYVPPGHVFVLHFTIVGLQTKLSLLSYFFPTSLDAPLV